MTLVILKMISNIFIFFYYAKAFNDFHGSRDSQIYSFDFHNFCDPRMDFFYFHDFINYRIGSYNFKEFLLLSV